MLSASAYSFRQKSRLAISLSWVAGYTNVITFILCAVVTSHATGNVTHFGKALADRINGAARETRRGRRCTSAGWWSRSSSARSCRPCMTEGARRAGFRSKYILPMARRRRCC